jgi:hypothetical protein
MAQARTKVRATVKIGSIHFLTVDLGKQLAPPLPYTQLQTVLEIKNRRASNAFAIEKERCGRSSSQPRFPAATGDTI